MSEEFGSDFITVTSDDGEEFTLEVLDIMDYNNKTYGAFLPADMKEDDPDYGMVILRIAVDDNGEEYFEDVEDDAELNDVYEHFLVLLYDDEEGEEEESKD